MNITCLASASPNGAEVLEEKMTGWYGWSLTNPQEGPKEFCV